MNQAYDGDKARLGRVASPGCARYGLGQDAPGDLRQQVSRGSGAIHTALKHFTTRRDPGKRCFTAGVAQLVEHQVVVLGVVGSIPIARPTFGVAVALVAAALPKSIAQLGRR